MKIKRKSTKIKAEEYTIYGIYDGDKLLYIGSSQNHKQRWEKHNTDLVNGKHKNKALQKYYNTMDKKNLHFEVIFQYSHKKLINLRVLEYIATSYFEPLCNKTFNMANSGRCDTMALMDKDKAENIWRIITNE